MFFKKIIWSYKTYMFYFKRSKLTIYYLWKCTKCLMPHVYIPYSELNFFEANCYVLNNIICSLFNFWVKNPYVFFNFSYMQSILIFQKKKNNLSSLSCKKVSSDFGLSLSFYSSNRIVWLPEIEMKNQI